MLIGIKKVGFISLKLDFDNFKSCPPEIFKFAKNQNILIHLDYKIVFI